MVVSYVQSFITYGGAPYGPSPGHAGAVYPPPTPAANSSDAAGANNAAAFPTLLYMVWVAFTYCYFHGCGHVALHQAGQGAAGRGAATGSKDESRMAFDWLNRLVGERGWHPNGPVHGAIQQWVSSMKRRLAEVFPQHDWSRLTAASWPDVESSVRELGERRAAGGGGGEEEPYTPVYPFRVTGGHNNNRVKVRTWVAGGRCARDASAGRWCLTAGAGVRQERRPVTRREGALRYAAKRPSVASSWAGTAWQRGTVQCRGAAHRIPKLTCSSGCTCQRKRIAAC